MDGSYGNIFPTSRGMSPSAPPPSGNQYKVNVNRQKTKKWANFRPQNYDGDDWGDDYDEPAHEPEPPPPPKPMGPRQPAAHSPTARPFQPVGSPPLRTHTQPYAVPASARPGQAPTVPGPPSMASGTPWKATEAFESSPPSAQGDSQPHTITDATHPSPSPRSPHQLPSQVPTRKGSIDPDDAADALENMKQSGFDPRPSDNSRSWMETGSASPRSAAGLLVSSDKPISLIRPAEVYKRMEDERLKGRLPPGTGGSAADNAGARTGESLVSEIQLQGDPPNRPLGSPDTEDSRTGRTLQPASGLTSIAERQSEYGIEGLLASYGGEGNEAEPPSSEEQKRLAESQKSVQPLSLEHIRRFSTSPQLPDLTRMSSFGEDLFSSSFFPASGLRSPVSGSMQLPTLGEDIPKSSKATAAEAQPPAQSTGLATTKSMVSNTAKDANFTPEKGTSQPASSASGMADHAVSLPPNVPEKDQPVELPSHEVAAQMVFRNPEQQTPAEDAEREPASRNEDRPATLATRPHMPGGWVTETPATPLDVAASPAARSPMPGNLVTETPSTPPEVPPSPATSAAHEKPGKASAVEGVPGVDARPESASLKASDSRGLEPEVGVASDDGVINAPNSATLDPASPHRPPPLGNANPALDTKFNMGSHNSPVKVADRKASPDPEIQAVDTSSPIPASSITEKSEITPTAPLNPRRGTPDDNATGHPVLSQPPITKEPTRDAETHSPVKDSDKLSEEIMKSLSPVQSGSGFLDTAEVSIAAYHAAAAERTRESSYLGDVYGDYWAATEDKVEPGLPTIIKAVDTGKTGRNPLPIPIKDSAECLSVPPGMVGLSSSFAPTQVAQAKVSDLHPESSGRADELETRFSWEAGHQRPAPATISSPATVSPPDTGPPLQTGQLAELDSGAENASPLRAELGVSTIETPQPSPGPEVLKLADELRAESAPEFNPEGAPAPMPIPDRLTQPSPLSDIMEPQGGDKRQSLAEEKIVLQESLHAGSTPPPLEQHPAFARNHESRLAENPSAPSPKNIVGFRNIMEMPSTAERIKLYNETRWQFAAVNTGLEEWLREMMARHPEHASTLMSSQGTAAMVAHAQQSGHGATAQASQGAGQSLRAPGHLHIPHLQHGLSGLGHSSNQVGTKSKELLMAAGKAGKGLFSKGRNKLRGAGNL
ncbi:hypothetical protein N657DRAFT_356081 [Parathielavia appendiculata]|uniref:Uncharacterized protein n=1 Tax=Parathielavia appendiculata TaxID=2587402 RepID=A0AAN6Z5A2_9PEZI|nr:hypothetical protein N657DRAFT_356081 [Parathielavia appendiculata]